MLTDFSWGGDFIYALIIQPDGKILATGGVNSTLVNTNTGLARFNQDGSYDADFGDSGRVIKKFTGNYSYGWDITVQSNDKIIVACEVGMPGFSDFGVLRFDSKGKPDSSFGEAGQQITDFFELDAAYDLTVLDDGKIIVAGQAIQRGNPSKYYYAVARYFGDPVKDSRYVRIKQWLHRHGFTWDDCPQKICTDLGSYSIQRSTNGKSFNEIARVYRSNNQQHYNYEDAVPLSGTNYYRLAAVSSDNSVIYSNVIAIEDNEAAIKLYPNPVKDNLHIEGLSSTQRTKLTITDFSGIVKANTTITTNSYNWNIAQLKAGNYMLRIETNGGVAVTKKFVKE